MNTSFGGRAIAGVLALSVAVFAAGCSSSSTSGKGAESAESGKESVATGTTSTPTLEQARKAGTIAGAIEKEPNRSAEILAENGVSSESFEKLVIDIAKDSLLARAYEEAKAAAK